MPDKRDEVNRYGNTIDRIVDKWQQDTEKELANPWRVKLSAGSAVKV